MPISPVIPEFITVHLGPPDSDAQNVTVSFIDYIKNVASGEIYPTWPESSLRANIYAQISFALNKIFVEFYRARGYSFDITGSTSIDQTYVYGRNTFENIDTIVDDIFDSYVRRFGQLEPLSTRFCNGTTTTCEGLSQWGSVDLANQGFVPYDILTYYYGDDIEIVTDVPVESIEESYPGTPLRLGDVSADVATAKINLNRISINYPAIPKVTVSREFDEDFENAIKKFQQIFNLTQDGIIGRQTWYQLSYLYVGITRLTEIDSEGIRLSELPIGSSVAVSGYTDDIKLIQYFLSVLAYSYPVVPNVPITGIYDETTVYAVKEFQKLFGLTPDGILTEETYALLYDSYITVAKFYDENKENLPLEFKTAGNIDTVYSKGDVHPDIQIIQNRLNFINDSTIAETGLFGPLTEKSVADYQRKNNLAVTGRISPEDFRHINNTYYDVAAQFVVLPTQYPGFVMKKGMSDNTIKSLSTPIYNLQVLIRNINQGEIIPDGYFDDKTEQAVIVIQREANLTPNGEVDFYTFEEIRNRGGL